MYFPGITVVTGATGFIGQHLVRHLVAEGTQVRASDLASSDASYLNDMGVEFIAADVTRPETLRPLFAGGVDRVFHLGAICNFSTSYEKLHPVNVRGVDHITRLALAAQVKRYIHMSSTSVYGSYKGKPFIEDAARAPQDNYGLSKREGEEIVWRRIREGLPAIIVRPCTVYGPGCNDGAGKVFSRPTRIRAIPGSGGQLLSNVRVEDVAAAAVHLSRQDEAVGRAFNLADDSHPTLGRALAVAASAFGTPSPRLHLPVAIVRVLARVSAFSAGASRRIPDLEPDAVEYLAGDYVVDNTALKRTGYRLIHPDFERSIRQMGEWYRSAQDEMTREEGQGKRCEL